MKFKSTILVILLFCSFNVSSQWFLSDSTLTGQAVHVDFPHADAAYALTGFGKLYKSSDMGVNWSEQYDFGPFSSLLRIHFMNKDTGFASGYGWVMRTFDGGTTWNYINNPWIGSSLWYMSNFKVVQNKLIASYEDNDTSYITRSDDYGDTFYTVYEQYDSLAKPYSLAMLDSVTGYFINQNELERLYYTGDGFLTIDTVVITSGPLSIQQEFSYIDPIRGFLYGGWGAQSNPMRNWINDGSIWGHVDLDGFGVLPVLDLDWNTDELYASSLYGKIFISYNLGQYWIEQTTPVTDPVQSVAFLDSLHGIAASDFRLMYTSNGGFTGVEELSDYLVTVYPNPTNGEIEIAGSFQVEKIELYDLSGKLRKTEVSSNRIDLSEMPSGLYLITIYTDKGVVIKRVIRS